MARNKTQENQPPQKRIKNVGTRNSLPLGHGFKESGRVLKDHKIIVTIAPEERYIYKKIMPANQSSRGAAHNKYRSAGALVSVCYFKL